MSRIWIEEIEDGQLVEEMYYLRSKSLGTTKAGKPYLILTISDRTGEMEGRAWENAARLDAAVAEGDFVLLRGKGGTYNKQVQLSVYQLETVPPEQVDYELFLPVCPRDREAYERLVAEKIESLRDNTLQRLCRAALDDPELSDGLRRAPAATGVHQAYIGGLLEHTCSMMLLAEKVSDHYPALDRDLLLAGILFHDLGKLREMAYLKALDYTDQGKLVGHLVIGVEIVDQLAAGFPDLAPERVLLLKHLILAHHGKPDFGSPRVPMIAEAAVLHHLDNLDAKVFAFLEAERDNPQGNWSERKWFLDTAVYKIPRAQGGYFFRLGEAEGKAKKDNLTKVKTKNAPLEKNAGQKNLPF